MDSNNKEQSHARPGELYCDTVYFKYYFCQISECYILKINLHFLLFVQFLLHKNLKNKKKPFDPIRKLPFPFCSTALDFQKFLISCCIEVHEITEVQNQDSMCGDPN